MIPVLKGQKSQSIIFTNGLSKQFFPAYGLFFCESPKYSRKWWF